MAGWEEELAVLLRELGVKQEEPQAHLQQARKPRRSNGRRREPYTDALFWASEEAMDEDDESLEDLESMRTEVDSIVSQVILLMQRGRLDASLKEDVMVVLRALRRYNPVAHSATSSDEAYLESASAILHFCRLVLQLSEFSTEE